MSLLQESTDNALDLPIGLRSINIGKFLTDTALLASRTDACCSASAYLCRYVVIAIGTINLIRALGNNCGYEEEASSADLDLSGRIAASKS
ncbi:hypothetical protein [Nitrosomonas sp. Nm58]|uniref:hypothetical protein n=1 Tax=Nitrosomonas sp. Nm58 TaxID=200126 RepID=UPI0008969D80|nr:hypothetical protein [Nitrosomonas sp. Nm58]SDY93426.1 hypothetical protein SAMN05421754_103222 [Nitrosomonas sp. Nm58]